MEGKARANCAHVHSGMVRNKKVLIALVLALWGASVVVMFKSTAPQVPKVHAAEHGQPFSVTATLKTDTTNTIEVKIIPESNAAAAYNIERKFVDGLETKVTDVSKLTKPKTIHIDSGLANGTYTYTVKALKANGDPGIPAISAISNTVTIGPSTVPAPGGGATTPVAGAIASPWLSQECQDAANAAEKAAGETKGQVFTNSIYDTINSEGVKTVYKWTLSLVNLLVLFFLLIIAFSNILRLNIDTYAVQKVFTPLILGVLLANFGWLICRFFLEISTILYHALTEPYGGGAGLFKTIAENGYGTNNICAIAKGETLGFGASLLGSFVGTALMLVAGILILTLYVLLVARVWVVTLLIVLSPLAFLSLGFPMTQAYFKKWWSMFFNWVFMAPASFLILVLAVKMADISEGPSLTKYIIITGLLYFAIQVPFKMGGEWMTKWGGVVSQFKQKSGKLALTAADKSTKGLRVGASKYLQTKAWDSAIGQKIAGSRERKALKTGNLDSRLKAAQLLGGDIYRTSDHGIQLLKEQGKYGERARVLEDARKGSDQQGLVDFNQSSDPEAIRIRNRLAEIAQKQTYNTDKLHHFAEEGQLEFNQSIEGRELSEEAAGLAREKTKLEEELKILEGTAKGAFEKTTEGTAISEDIARLQTENLKIEKEVSNKQKVQALKFADSAPGRILSGRMKELGIEETTIDNFMAKAAATGAQEFLDNDPDRARLLVEGLVSSGLQKDEAENLVKSVENEMGVEYLDNTRGSTALRKANFSQQEIKDYTEMARSRGGLTLANKNRVRKRLTSSGMSVAEADSTIDSLASTDLSGLEQNVKTEKAKLSATLAEADVEASEKTALGLAQNQEIDNDKTVQKRLTSLEKAKRAHTPSASRITILEDQLQAARINASQNSSIARAAVIATKDGLKEAESANSLLFYDGETNGRMVLDRRTHYQGFVNTNETAVKNIEALSQQKYRAGTDTERDEIAKRIGISKAELDKEIERIDTVSIENIYTIKNAERETRKGKERVLGAIIHSQSYIEREEAAGRRFTSLDNEHTAMKIDVIAKRTATTVTPEEESTLLAKEAELKEAIAERTARTSDKVEYVKLVNQAGKPKTGDEKNWEKVGTNWELKTMNRVDLDRLRLEYAIALRERATNESLRSIDELKAEYDGVGIDVADTIVEETDSAGTVTERTITGKESVQAALNGDHVTISKIIHNGYEVETDASGIKTRGKKRDTRYLHKMNGVIEAGLDLMGRYMDPKGQKLLPYFATDTIPSEMLEKVIAKFQETPRYTGIDAKAKTPAGKFKADLETAMSDNDTKAKRAAFAALSDQALQKLFIGTIKEIRGSTRETS